MARTKEYRRFMESTKLERRIKNFYHNSTWWSVDVNSFAEYRELVMKGQKDVWLRNTGVPCSCYMCSGYYKYDRPIKSEINNIIKDQLE